MRTFTKLIDAASEGDSFEELFEEGVILPLSVTGTSMLPLLHPERSVVMLEGISGETVKKGDILLFRRENGSFVLHRVRKCFPDGCLQMNGDAQDWCEVIERERVIAVVREVITDGRHENRIFIQLYNHLWPLTFGFRRSLIAVAISVRRIFPRKQRGTK